MKRSWLAPLLGLLVLGVGLWQLSALSTSARPPLVDNGIFPVATAQSTEEVLHYPRLELSAPITNNPNTDPFNQEDWQRIQESLTRGVSLTYAGEQFSSAAFAYIIGHSSDVTRHPYDNIFAILGQSQVGDEFSLEVEGEVYSFRVTESVIFDPRDTEKFFELANRPSEVKRVALVTCWPPLTTKQRLVVIGEEQR